jgi:hypothetical protein
MRNKSFFVIIVLFILALAVTTKVYAMPEGIWTSHETKQYKLWEALNGKGLKKTDKEIAKVNLEKWRIDSHIEMLRETNQSKDVLIDSQGIAFKSDVPISKIRVISQNKEYAEFEPLFSYVYFQDIIDYSTERAAGKNLTILFLSSWYQKSKELVAFSIECHIPEKVEVIPLNQEEASKLFPVAEAKPEE